ncbi:MAG: outer membrane beta-barrel protein [Cyclobacteriaceae bacterium]
MKRFFYSFIVFSIAFSVKCSAQLHVGPVAGLSMSKIYFFDSHPEFKSNPAFGFDVGVMSSFSVRKNFRLNAQLLFSQRGKDIVGTTSASTGGRVDPQFKLTARMNYIELPIFYALEFKKISTNEVSVGGRKVYNWYIGAGPVITYWLSTKGTIRSSNLLENQIDHLDYKGYFGNSYQSKTQDANKENIPDANRFQFGLNFTVGLTFQPDVNHKIMASLHLNLMQSFQGTGVGNFPGTDPIDQDILKSRINTLRFSVAYLFDTHIEKRKRGKTTSRIIKRGR